MMNHVRMIGVAMLMSLVSGVANANSCTIINSYSQAQRDVIQFSYDYGKEYNLGYTLAAISIRESHAGKINLNISDPSFGPYHVTIQNALHYHGWRDTGYNRNVLAQMMMDDIELSAAFAIENLRGWQRIHGSSNWKQIWASYNAGHAGYDSPAGREYAGIIASNISKLKKCLRLEKVE